MGKQRQKQQGKRSRGLSGRQSMWSWTSRGLSVPQRAWLSLREQDFYQPPQHYNLHIQPLHGGSDYHNYHIRYLGTGETRHIWLAVDAPSGITSSCRIYSFSKKLFIGEVIDIASSLLVTDITNDVGDPGIWLALVEHMPFALRDLYRHTTFSQNKIARRKSQARSKVG